MHFTNLFVSALAATLVASSPVKTIERRCDIGRACWISDIVNEQATTANSIAASLQSDLTTSQGILAGPIGDICAGFTAAANGLTALAAGQQVYVNELTSINATAVPTLVAEINVVISPAINLIKGYQAQATAVVVDESGKLAAAQAAVTAGINDVAAVVGPCLPPS